MIENNTSSNPKLTFEQLQAIEVAQKTLANLQSEITNATKFLKGTKTECDVAVKDKTYQEELLTSKTLEVETKQKELDDLKTNLLDISYKVDDLNKELKEKTLTINAKEIEIKDRETKIISREKDLNEKSQSLDRTAETMSESYKVFYDKVAKLKEVISQI